MSLGCLPTPAVPNLTLGGGLSLQPPPLTIPSFGLLCCATPILTVQLPGISVSASVTLPLAAIVEVAIDTVEAYLDQVPLPCLKDPPPVGEL